MNDQTNNFLPSISSSGKRIRFTRFNSLMEAFDLIWQDIFDDVDIIFPKQLTWRQPVEAGHTWTQLVGGGVMWPKSNQWQSAFAWLEWPWKYSPLCYCLSRSECLKLLIDAFVRDVFSDDDKHIGFKDFFKNCNDLLIGSIISRFLINVKAVINGRSYGKHSTYLNHARLQSPNECST